MLVDTLELLEVIVLEVVELTELDNELEGLDVLVEP